jgi:hypothetical protein
MEVCNYIYIFKKKKKKKIGTSNFILFYLRFEELGKSIVHPPKLAAIFNSAIKVSISFNSGTFSQNALNSDLFFPKCPQQ